jgi:hypothetical protein
MKLLAKASCTKGKGKPPKPLTTTGPLQGRADTSSLQCLPPSLHLPLHGNATRIPENAIAVAVASPFGITIISPTNHAAISLGSTHVLPFIEGAFVAPSKKNSQHKNGVGTFVWP